MVIKVCANCESSLTIMMINNSKAKLIGYDGHCPYCNVDKLAWYEMPSICNICEYSRDCAVSVDISEIICLRQKAGNKCLFIKREQ